MRKTKPLGSKYPKDEFLMTKSEMLFEKLCKAKSIRYEHIKVGKNKTSDYQIWLNSTRLIAEVKQIETSDHEHQLVSNAEIDGPFIISDVVTRIRNKFDKAKKQLRNYSCDELPCLFVLFDNPGGLSGMSNDDFLQAMFGDETLRVYSKISKQPPVIQKVTHIFGGQRKVSSSYNTFVSGFCRLLLDDKGEPYLILFHNKYARFRLNLEIAKSIAHKQFELPNLKEGEYRGWNEIV